MPALVRLFGMYFAATRWGDFLSYDEKRAAPRLLQLISQKYTPHLVAYDRDELVGIMSWHYDIQYTNEPIGVLDEVFVMPAYRRTDLGRKLVALALHIAAKHGAAVFNFPIASGLPETKTLANMLRHKFGGVYCGVIVRCVPQEAPYGRQE